MTISAFTDKRRVMVESQLRPSNVSAPAVFGAMATIERENFVPENKKNMAYIDRGVELDNGRWLSPPLAHGLLINRSALKKGDRVLVIGGSGYPAALAAHLGADVTFIENDDNMLAIAKAALEKYGNVAIYNAPLTKGLAANAPYDAIIIDGAVGFIPDVLTEQLAENGVLACGLVRDGIIQLALGRKTASAFSAMPFVESDIAPLQEFAQKAEYQF